MKSNTRSTLALSPRSPRDSEMSIRTLPLALLLLVLPSLALSFPFGGMPVCSYDDTRSQTMHIQHGRGLSEPRATLTATPEGEGYRISLTGIPSFTGLILWVRDASTSQHVGRFSVSEDTGLRGKDCSGMTGASSGKLSTLEHYDRDYKTTLAFAWMPDAAVTKETRLVAEAVVVESDNEIWYTAFPAFFTLGGSSLTPSSTPTPVPPANSAEPHAVVPMKSIVDDMEEDDDEHF
ncbi:hypothetical protein M427DRAFT_154650 [Gonapodya prolifera JEL478]|uniref:Reelin domain-containing protein n=1 Tax=Gonapodya prolifera (strain JEL478) TaxID=1344416 RepID=A0A139AI10_GONPJ|nr:hypothetical protein M427DRAFT_154650 [Gonapodya prolifera JEL478]|eukprot:KXS16329.1 hypothetical protein M427DRAFT_154650 [Gonapodya prolifera JEL478]